jgi:hypothetical protein
MHHQNCIQEKITHFKPQSQLAVRASTGGLQAFLVNIVRDTQGRRTIFMDRTVPVTVPVSTYGGCWI